jgi:hypothetical protein
VLPGWPEIAVIVTPESSRKLHRDTGLYSHIIAMASLEEGALAVEVIIPFFKGF